MTDWNRRVDAVDHVAWGIMLGLGIFAGMMGAYVAIGLIAVFLFLAGVAEAIYDAGKRSRT